MVAAEKPPQVHRISSLGPSSAAQSALFWGREIKDSKLHEKGDILVTGGSLAGIGASFARKTNQDSLFLTEPSDRSTQCLILGCFDGHGPSGEMCSDYLTHQLVPAISRNARAEGRLNKKTLTQAFLETDNGLKKSDWDTNFSGSTGVVVVLDGQTLTVAHVGDSRAILGSIDARGRMKARALTRDHNPEDSTERRRIVEYGGRIDRLRIDGNEEGPLRVWLKERNVPGLTMTRAFGDEMGHSVGVIAEPEVDSMVLNDQDHFLVLCSDGVTEFMSDAEIIEKVKDLALEGLAPGEVINTILEISQDRWRCNEHGISDDCSMLLVYLKPHLYNATAAKPVAAAAAQSRAISVGRTRPAETAAPKVQLSQASDGRLLQRRTTELYALAHPSGNSSGSPWASAPWSSGNSTAAAGGRIPLPALASPPAAAAAAKQEEDEKRVSRNPLFKIFRRNTKNAEEARPQPLPHQIPVLTAEETLARRSKQAAAADIPRTLSHPAVIPTAPPASILHHDIGYGEKDKPSTGSTMSIAAARQVGTGRAKSFTRLGFPSHVLGREHSAGPGGALSAGSAALASQEDAPHHAAHPASDPNLGVRRTVSFRPEGGLAGLREREREAQLRRGSMGTDMQASETAKMGHSATEQRLMPDTRRSKAKSNLYRSDDTLSTRFAASGSLNVPEALLRPARPSANTLGALASSSPSSGALSHHAADIMSDLRRSSGSVSDGTAAEDLAALRRSPSRTAAARPLGTRLAELQSQGSSQASRLSPMVHTPRGTGAAQPTVGILAGATSRRALPKYSAGDA